MKLFDGDGAKFDFTCSSVDACSSAGVDSENFLGGGEIFLTGQGRLELHKNRKPPDPIEGCASILKW